MMTAKSAATIVLLLYTIVLQYYYYYATRGHIILAVRLPTAHARVLSVVRIWHVRIRCTNMARVHALWERSNCSAHNSLRGDTYYHASKRGSGRRLVSVGIFGIG